MASQLTMLGLGVLFFFIIVGLTLFSVGIYNTIIELRGEIEKSWANIDVILKQRFEEIPKLMDVCEQFLEHEESIIDQVSNARDKLVSSNRGAQIEGAVGASLSTHFIFREEQKQKCSLKK